ncbi:MAG: hypothetical protein U0T84_06525 [Chitinophagales bacterium]
MKTFLRLLFFFLAPMLVLMYPADRYLSAQLSKSVHFALGEYPVWNALTSGKLDADVLVYGSSRAWVHFNPEVIQDSLHLPAYNLGMDGHGLPFQYLRHQMVLEYNKKPKLIIHSIEPGSLVKQPSCNYEQFMPYMLGSREIEQTTAGYEGFNRFQFWLPLLRYTGHWDAVRVALHQAQHPDNPEEGRKRGFRSNPSAWTNDFEEAKKREKELVMVMNDSLLSLLDRYLQEVKQEQIPIVLVYCPTYIEGQQYIRDHDKMLAVLKQHAQQAQVPFLDFSRDTLCYHREYFYNANHMNSRGVAIFNRTLIQQVKALFPKLLQASSSAEIH